MARPFPTFAPAQRTVPIGQLGKVIAADLKAFLAAVPEDKANIVIDDITDLQRKGEFPGNTKEFISRVSGRIVPNETLFESIRRARFDARVEVSTTTGNETLTAPFRMLRQLINARTPVVTGRYKDSFVFWLNGKEVAFVNDIGSSGRSIVICYNTAVYASSLETVRLGGVMHGIAVQLKAAFPSYRIGFGYRKPTDLTQDVRIGKDGQRQQYAVPIIYIGTPSSNAINSIKMPGRNARRRIRAARRRPQGNL